MNKKIIKILYDNHVDKIFNSDKFTIENYIESIYKTYGINKNHILLGINTISKSVNGRTLLSKVFNNSIGFSNDGMDAYQKHIVNIISVNKDVFNKSLADSRSLLSFLSDYNKQDSEEWINRSLVDAYEKGIVNILERKNYNDKKLRKIIDELVSDIGLDTNIAYWSVYTWAYIYGKNVNLLVKKQNKLKPQYIKKILLASTLGIISLVFVINMNNKEETTNEYKEPIDSYIVKNNEKVLDISKDITNFGIEPSISFEEASLVAESKFGGLEEMSVDSSFPDGGTLKRHKSKDMITDADGTKYYLELTTYFDDNNSEVRSTSFTTVLDNKENDYALYCAQQFVYAMNKIYEQYGVVGEGSLYGSMNDREDIDSNCDINKVVEYINKRLTDTEKNYRSIAGCDFFLDDETILTVSLMWNKLDDRKDCLMLRISK